MERSLVGNYEYLLANFLKVLGIEIGTLDKRVILRNRSRGISGFHISLLLFFYSFPIVVLTLKQNISGQQTLNLSYCYFY